MTVVIPPRDTPALDWLCRAGACDEGVRWVEREGIATLGQAWDQCARPDWLLWGLDAVRWPARAMTGLSCWFVRHTTLPGDRPFTDLLTDSRSRRALEVAEAWVLRVVGGRKMQAAYEEAWDAVVEARNHRIEDSMYAASVAAYHAALVAQCVVAPPGRTYLIPPVVSVLEHLDLSLQWVATWGRCEMEEALRGAMAARLDGIRRLIIDPWQAQLGK